ncbi:hypothetical protein [Vreelandella populi]|uniref:hypothetical protein n=1 Tax=Vreelandella populi TaxID=2498858 RepID=UPI00163D11D3|nr:hypothetical protein [Halomonas populi]
MRHPRVAASSRLGRATKPNPGSAWRAAPAGALALTTRYGYGVTAITHWVWRYIRCWQ